MAITVAQKGEVFYGWGSIKVGSEWAGGTEPPSAKLNWWEQEGT